MFIKMLLLLGLIVKQWLWWCR